MPQECQRKPRVTFRKCLSRKRAHLKLSLPPPFGLEGRRNGWSSSSLTELRRRSRAPRLAGQRGGRDLGTCFGRTLLQSLFADPSPVFVCVTKKLVFCLSHCYFGFPVTCSQKKTHEYYLIKFLKKRGQKQRSRETRGAA